MGVPGKLPLQLVHGVPLCAQEQPLVFINRKIKMAESTVSTNYYGYLEAVAGKGPCRDSESVYRSCKKIYKKMIGLCRQLPVSRYPDITGGRYILLSEDGSAVGSAPGLRKENVSTTSDVRISRDWPH